VSTTQQTTTSERLEHLEHHPRTQGGRGHSSSGES
jgi:hypothetical protein